MELHGGGDFRQVREVTVWSGRLIRFHFFHLVHDFPINVTQVGELQVGRFSVVVGRRR